jgi:hypothetical protein
MGPPFRGHNLDCSYAYPSCKVSSKFDWVLTDFTQRVPGKNSKMDIPIKKELAILKDEIGAVFENSSDAWL